MSDSREIDDEMAEFLQVFLDETSEQLDELVEAMLTLESDPSSQEELNEAFRLIHSIKGSAGMMGLDNITSLTHHLESRFEGYRSGAAQLDEPTMNVTLRAIDYLRRCNERLRDGEKTESPAELLEALDRLGEGHSKPAASSDRGAPEPDSPQPDSPQPEPPESVSQGALQAESKTPLAPAAPDRSGEQDEAQATESDSPTIEAGRRKMVVRVQFCEGLQLADLKARLIATRLGALGELVGSEPDLSADSELDDIKSIELVLETNSSAQEVSAVADVDGVESIECTTAPNRVAEEDREGDPLSAADIVEDGRAEQGSSVEGSPDSQEMEGSPDSQEIAPQLESDLETPTLSDADVAAGSLSKPGAEAAAGPSEPAEAAKASLRRPVEPEASKVVETMRVDIDRLDNLMNLTGELVVNRARFVQIASQISPAFRKSSVSNRIREFCDGLRGTLKEMESSSQEFSERDKLVEQLRSGLLLMDEHVETWEQSRQHVEKMSEAIDQLSLVSHSLQQGVFDTRMVPVGPLFNRFKRVVRDLSKERGKQVHLEIRGEKTELDKRMIDELGDPLVHLVRNSIDHGMESPQQRVEQGKSETGTITLEATHSGNSVSIHVRDDGGGIDVAKIKAKIAQKGLLSEEEVHQLSDEQALDYIWHPGFSTAGQVTDVSGRGVGMDVVRNRIRQLNGTIELESEKGRGTSFTLRLPLTLAIIRCLLARLRGAVFSMPIEAVREIVSVNLGDVIQVHDRQAFEVRDEIIHLVGLGDIFHWHESDQAIHKKHLEMEPSDADTLEVVVLQMGGKTMGLKVDELIGSQDMVIKSLSDNFVDIRGLSGASILGDGSVCLMLDVGALFQLAKDRPMSQTKELAGE